MVSINASSTIKIPKKPVAVPKSKSKAANKGTTSRKATPPLKPSPAGMYAAAGLENNPSLKDLMCLAMGERPFSALSAPHTESTTQSRGYAAADLAVALFAGNDLEAGKQLKESGILDELSNILYPTGGIPALFGGRSRMKRISSAASLKSLDSGGGGGSSVFTGTSAAKSSSAIDRLKTASANAREGALLILRALAEYCSPNGNNKPYLMEPYVVPFFPLVLEESGSGYGAVREAAEACIKAIIKLVNAIAVPVMICPILFEAIEHSPEWRVKACALESLSELSEVAPGQISVQLPKIVPLLSSEVFDTKPQVSKAAGECLLACCKTNKNPDVAPAIPAVVKSIIKPAETVKAIEELMGTTFVAAVDASTLSILCPVLARGLKEKNALPKRNCSIVIENMSRLVDSPEAVAPFGPLLVPELKKVAENVQFEEIRDAALAALKTLAKALGHGSVEEAFSTMIAEEAARAEEEERRIAEEREEEKRREEENRIKEEEERRLFKEAMDAQRQLDKLKLEDEEKKKAEKAKEKEKDKRSVKTRAGKCQGCGLKKCPKTCLFYGKN